MEISTRAGKNKGCKHLYRVTHVNHTTSQMTSPGRKCLVNIRGGSRRADGIASVLEKCGKWKASSEVCLGFVTDVGCGRR